MFCVVELRPCTFCQVTGEAGKASDEAGEDVPDVKAIKERPMGFVDAEDVVGAPDSP